MRSAWTNAVRAIMIGRAKSESDSYRADPNEPRRQMPAVRKRGCVDARFAVAAVLLRALQADRPWRMGERALSDRGARINGFDRRSARFARRLLESQPEGHACRRIAMPCAPRAMAMSRSSRC